MNAQLEIQTQDTEVEDVALQIGGILTDAFTLLVDRRDRQYADAIEPLDTERDALEQESTSIAFARRNLERLLPAKAREAQRAADALMVAGDAEGAKAKITEAEEAANAPGAMSERQRDITARIEAIDREKGAIARRIFEAWYGDAQRVIRAAETGLFVTLLNGVEESVIDYQARTGVEGTLMKLFHVTNLTADERSAEWKAGTRWYGGGVR
jgi:hypothetical protein